MGNFDIGFEKYIIFHRGIAEIKLETVDDGNGNQVERLHAIYQDGYVQDLGDPYGDGARNAAALAEAAQSAAEAAKSDVLESQEDVTEKTSAFNTDYAHFVEQITDFAGTLAEAQDAANRAETAAQEAAQAVDTGINAVQGIIRDEVTGMFRLDYNSLDEKTEDVIVKVDGLQKDEVTGQLYVDYSPAVSQSDDNTKYTIENIKGLKVNEDGSYEVDLQTMTDEEVDALFEQKVEPDSEDEEEPVDDESEGGE